MNFKCSLGCPNVSRHLGDWSGWLFFAAVGFVTPSRHLFDSFSRCTQRGFVRSARKFCWDVIGSTGFVMAVLSLSGCHDDVAAPAPPREATTPTTVDAVEPVAPDLLESARRSLARKDLGKAEDDLRKQLLRDPQDEQAMELLGDVAAQRGDRNTSVEMYRESIALFDLPPQRLFEKLSHESLAAGLPFDALDVLTESIERYPNQLQARYDLVGLSAAIGLPRIALPTLRWLAQHGKGDPESLILMADPDRAEPDAEMCSKLLARFPTERRPEYSLARLDAIEMRWNDVVKRLEPIVQAYPDFVPAYTLLGRAAVEVNDFERLVKWKQSAPVAAERSPEYWVTAGLWAQKQGHHDQAARALWEALRLDPIGQPEVLTSLAFSLNQIGRQDAAKVIADQITKHSELRDAMMTHFERKSASQRAAMRVADAMMSLGRIWEGEAWARLAVSLPKEPVTGIRDKYLAIRSQLKVDAPWQLSEMTIGQQIDLSDLPLMEWTVKANAPSEAEASGMAKGVFSFEDQARQRGWVHTCEIAEEATKEGHWIHQSVGGGVGVIDYDLDGWPDIAVATLDGKALQSDSSPNRLFRNVQGHFIDASGQASYDDTGFSQGIAIGDFNEDGFPDIFDANIGRNRLYRNNGDGTFREVARAAGLSGEVWTTSLAMADIDGDGFSDLYEAHYCRSPEPFEVACRNQQGHLGTCPPLKFDAEPDRVWQGVGDGTFIDASSRWMDETTPGRGLGVVVGSFDERQGLDVYVANDMTVNHLWSSGAGNNGFRLSELGAVRGLGVSGRGLAQASMGIATGDPDQDGDIDFFLTHFSDDHNTYYEQVGSGFWSDRSFAVGLAEPSMKLLGFGTQWCDFDNNGTLELIVANGHVDDVKRDDVSYRMPPQLFERDGKGHWVEHDRASLGDYFATDHLGRALATLDADRDGRTDVAITHLYDPVALLINQTKGMGRQICLELKATKGARDAIGTVVSMMVGQRKITTQLTAGDGYMCSQQRRLVIGTGGVDVATEVLVTWPSGLSQKCEDLESGGDYLIVEGADSAFQLGDSR